MNLTSQNQQYINKHSDEYSRRTETRSARVTTTKTTTTTKSTRSRTQKKMSSHHHKKGGGWRSVKRERSPKSIQATVSSSNFRVRDHVLEQKQFTDESISVQVFLKKSKIEVFVSCALIVMAVAVGLVNTSASLERQKEVFFKPVTVLYLSFMWLLSSYLLRKRQSETVRVVPNLGMDISGDRFYDIEKIENVIINETVTTTDAFYYLALIVKEGGGESRVVPLFRSVNPVPAQVLKKAFVGIREKLGMKI